jgi:hypothetical protein
MTDPNWASADEAKRIHEVVKHRTFPPGVKATEFDVTFGEDQTGRPAVWIMIPIDSGYQNPSANWVSEIREFVNRLRDDLLKERLHHWPYIDLKSPP